ncbi:MAG TPA: peptidoglycan-binding domain-containing protein [Candidatus Udaeobacter sp.]|nr:peptidoglycan-binding domain-containing protein [Candidatus Udaeobacter sp.]
MKRTFIPIIVGLSIALTSLVGVPAYGRGGGHGGGGHAGFSGGARVSGASPGYSGAGISRGGGSYGARRYSSGTSTGRYGSYRSYGQKYYAPRGATGGQVYGSSARSQSRIVSKQFARSPNYSGSYYVPADQSKVGFARKSAIHPRDYSGAKLAVRQQGAGITARSATRPDRAGSRQNLANRQRLDPQTTERLRNWQGRAPRFADAKRNHQEHWRDRHHHDHDWWRHHCDAIVLVGWGFWGWYDGWWYPAWGYDPYYSYYDYNGPIYGYGGFQPDEIIANVQAALQQLGYYPYTIDGVFGAMTEAAIANYQRDYGLSVTGAIDPPTVRSLGLGS